MPYICTSVQTYRQFKGFMRNTLELSLWELGGEEGWKRGKGKRNK